MKTPAKNRSCFVRHQYISCQFLHVLTHEMQLEAMWGNRGSFLIKGSNTLSVKYFIQNRKIFKIFRLKIFKFFRFWLGGAAPQTPQILAGGASPPQALPLNGRSSHLIEAAKRDRAADDTCAADDRTDDRPTSGRTNLRWIIYWIP